MENETQGSGLIVFNTLGGKYPGGLAVYDAYEMSSTDGTPKGVALAGRWVQEGSTKVNRETTLTGNRLFHEVG